MYFYQQMRQIGSLEGYRLSVLEHSLAGPAPGLFLWKLKTAGPENRCGSPALCFKVSGAWCPALRGYFSSRLSMLQPRTLAMR